MGRRWMGIQEASAGALYVWQASVAPVTTWNQTKRLQDPHQVPQTGFEGGLDQKRPHLIMCKSPLWGMPGLRLYRLAPSYNCHYPYKSKELHTSQIQPWDERNREECHDGKVGIKKGKWRERWRRRSQIFFLLFTSLNNKKVNAFHSPKIYLCLPGSWMLIAAAGELPYFVLPFSDLPVGKHQKRPAYRCVACAWDTIPPKEILNRRLSYWKSLPVIGSDWYSRVSVVRQFHIFICLIGFFSGFQVYVNCSFPFTLKFLYYPQCAPIIQFMSLRGWQEE